MNRPPPSQFVIEDVDNVVADSWSPDRVALLHLHYLQGMSAADSARLIGGVSRNAVISKRYRMGLFGRMPTVRPRLKRVTDPESGQVRYRRLAPREDLLAVTPLPQMDWPPPLSARPAILADRPARTCVWPLGPAEEPGGAATLFCCAPLAEHGSYCETHWRRARPQPTE